MVSRAERLATSRRRRQGETRLTAVARQRMHRFATQARLKPLVVAKVHKPPRLATRLQQRALQSFVAWRTHDACASEKAATSSPNLARAIATLRRVDEHMRLWVALCFWRVDEPDAWSIIEDDVLSERWSEVVRKLALRQQTVGSMQSSMHQTYVHPSIAAPGPEQHVMFFRHWRVALLRAQVSAPADARTSEVARVVARLQGVGVYMSKNLEATYFAMGLARFDVGSVGPGAHRACHVLLGLRAGHAQQGLWPWQSDPRNVRGVIRHVAAHVKCPWRDAQAALCWWWRWRCAQA